MVVATKNMPAENAKRLSIPLTDDGFIDTGSMRASTAQKFDHLIKNDPAIRDSFQTQHGGAEPNLAEGLTQANVAEGLNILASTNALVFRIAAARFIRNPVLKDKTGKPQPLVIDPDILTKTFSFTPEQHAELDPRAHRLALKYAGDMPEWLKKHLDLYMFGGMLLSYTAQNAKTAIEMQVKRDVNRYNVAWQQSQVVQPKNPQPTSDAAAPPANGHATTAETIRAQNREILTEPIMDALRQPQPPNDPIV
jgi:hypothetical protein